MCLLAPGPSLGRWGTPADGDPQAFGVGRYDLKIGINRAAIGHRVDAWCALDWRSHDARVGHPDRAVNGGIEVWAADVIGSPVLLTNAASAESLIRHGIAWRGEVVTTDAIAKVVPHAGPAAGELAGWTLLSVTSALVYAWWRGATRIDCYGVDQRGQADFDGVVAGSDRTVDRWQNKEIPLWNRLVAELRRRGVTIERHQP